jgi:putative DNA primase/helicase
MSDDENATGTPAADEAPASEPAQKKPRKTKGRPVEAPLPFSNDDAWKQLLLRNKEGAPKANLANAALVLKNDPKWIGKLAHDDLAERMVLLRAPPSHAALTGESYPRPWTDHDDTLTAIWLQRVHDVYVNDAVVAKAASAVAYHRRFHPVRDYLRSLTWDGVVRLPSWLTEHLGVAETPYTQAVGTMWMISAVARVMRPGCKADCALIFEGLQGLKKSTAIETLGGPWFVDQLANLGTKDADEQVRGAWLIELGELSSMARTEVEGTKAFISRKVDRFRVSYGRHVAAFPRQCVFAGSTNATAYLKDDTGNRRWWPVTCTRRCDVPALAAVRDQLWAEAVVRFDRGETWWIEDEALSALAQAEQEARYQADVWEPRIAGFLEGKAWVTVGEVLASAIGLEVSKWGQPEQNRVSKCLQRLRWHRRQIRDGAGRVWRYFPPEAAEATPGAGASPPTGPCPACEASDAEGSGPCLECGWLPGSGT